MTDTENSEIVQQVLQCLATAIKKLTEAREKVGSGDYGAVQELLDGATEDLNQAKLKLKSLQEPESSDDLKKRLQRNLKMLMAEVGDVAERVQAFGTRFLALQAETSEEVTTTEAKPINPKADP